MKTPIEVSEIRAGDLIRWESPDGDEAHESRIGNPRGTGFTPGHHFLLERPEPAVELPTEPTLGWLEHSVAPSRNIPSVILALWHVEDDGRWITSHDGRMIRPSNVTAFTPATAVPTVALDELRAVLKECWGKVEDEWPHMPRAVEDFLLAVDSGGQS